MSIDFKCHLWRNYFILSVNRMSLPLHGHVGTMCFSSRTPDPFLRNRWVAITLCLGGVLNRQVFDMYTYATPLLMIEVQDAYCNVWQVYDKLRIGFAPCMVTYMWPSERRSYSESQTPLLLWVRNWGLVNMRNPSFIHWIGYDML